MKKTYLKIKLFLDLAFLDIFVGLFVQLDFLTYKFARLKESITVSFQTRKNLSELSYLD
jgi:hypothetical protein